MRKYMQMIFRDPFSSLNPRMSVAQIISEPLLMYDMCGFVRELDERVGELMEIAGLAEPLSASYPHEMDGGSRQRVGIGSAGARPEIHRMRRAGVGALPVLAVDNASADEYAALADGLILTGGKDVEPSMCDETEPHPSVRCGPERDAMELRILRAFLNANKPVPGICRGLQLLNVFPGGTLWQNLPDDVGEHHESGAVHPVALAPDSVVGRLFGSRILVNSYHHQGVRTLGEDLRATAHALVDREKTIVEAFEHVNGRILAVQWHPERMLGASDASNAYKTPLFRYFIERACISPCA